MDREKQQVPLLRYPGFPVELVCVGELYAAFVNGKPHRRTLVRAEQQEIRVRSGSTAGKLESGCPPRHAWTVMDRVNQPGFLPTFASGLSGINWLGLLHIFYVSQQCSPVIKPVTAGHVISGACNGIVVFMNMSLFCPLLQKEVE